MRRLAALCLAALALAGAGLASGQTKPPAFLDAAPPTPRLQTPHLEAQAVGQVRVGTDGRGVVTVAVSPRAKMHVYAADVVGYVPFTLKVEPASVAIAGKATYPPAETYVFPPTGESSRVYMKPFTVTQHFALTPDARRTLAARGAMTATVSLRYQACDDTVCYRPLTASLSVDLVQ